jgi:hypothetical protein
MSKAKGIPDLDLIKLNYRSKGYHGYIIASRSDVDFFTVGKFGSRVVIARNSRTEVSRSPLKFAYEAEYEVGDAVELTATSPKQHLVSWMMHHKLPPSMHERLEPIVQSFLDEIDQPDLKVYI